MRRTVDWKKLALLLATILGLLFLNYNSGLQRYSDQIASCEFSKIYRDIPSRDAWQAAYDARHAAFERDGDPIDGTSAATYLKTVRGLTRVIDTPCRDRFDRPGVFG